MSRFKRSLSPPPPELGVLAGGVLELPALPLPKVPGLAELLPLLKPLVLPLLKLLVGGALDVLPPMREV